MRVAIDPGSSLRHPARTAEGRTFRDREGYLDGPDLVADVVRPDEPRHPSRPLDYGNPSILPGYIDGNRFASPLLPGTNYEPLATNLRSLDRAAAFRPHA